jgi:glycine cleavage system H protein
MLMKYYTKEHEWLELAADGIATVGITDYAQKQLGDVVYVELPAIGKAVTQSGEMAVVESVKAASEVYAPISGTVVAVNQDLPANPALVDRNRKGLAGLSSCSCRMRGSWPSCWMRRVIKPIWPVCRNIARKPLIPWSSPTCAIFPNRRRSPSDVGHLWR